MRFVTALIFVVAAAGAARAQEPERPDYWSELGGAGSPPPQQFKPDTLLGLRAGFLMGTDAEDAVPFIGVGVRFPVADVGAIELSADYWKDEYLEGDVEVVHAPLMISGLLYFPLEIPTTAPYIFAGVGMHVMSFEFSGAHAGQEDDDDSEFSFHGGGGLEITLGSALKIHMDVRWIMLDPDPESDDLQDENMDTVQFSFGLDLRF